MSRRPQPTTSAEPPTDQPSQPPTHQLLRTKSSADVSNRHAVRFPFARSYEEAAGVLKITRLSHEVGRLTIKLEGAILAPWVSSVRDACTQRGRRTRRLRLDLAAVTYADAAGAQLLRDLLREGVEIAACSSFLAELLRLGD